MRNRVEYRGLRAEGIAKTILSAFLFLLANTALMAAGVSATAVVTPAQAAAQPAAQKPAAAVKVKDTNKEQFAKVAAIMKAGMDYEKAKRYKSAFEQYSKIIAMRINYPGVYKRLANCYYAFKNYEFAVKYYKKYLESFPNDAATAAYAKKLEEMIKKKETRRMGTNVAGAEFKSPFTASLFSLIGLMPPACVFQGYGSYYARNRTQDFFPVSSSMAILGEFLIVADWAVRVNNVTGFDPLLAWMENFSAYLFSSALIFDYVSAPFMATESSLDFLYFAKNNEMRIEEKKVDYRDPAFTALISGVAGSVIPGAGHFYAGDNDTAVKLLIFTPLVSGAAMITGGILWGMSDPNMSLAGEITFYSGLGIYAICRMIDLYGSQAHCDKVNEEYYKQLLCPNSPYILKEKKDEKEPWLAFLISLVPVPGSGNFYAENYWTSATLLGAGAAGAAMYFGASGTDATSEYMRWGGLALMALSKIYDIASAPGYTAIYNAVYTNRQEREKSIGKVTMVPSLLQGGAALNLSYSF